MDSNFVKEFNRDFNNSYWKISRYIKFLNFYKKKRYILKPPNFFSEEEKVIIRKYMNFCKECEYYYIIICMVGILIGRNCVEIYKFVENEKLIKKFIKIENYKNEEGEIMTPFQISQKLFKNITIDGTINNIKLEIQKLLKNPKDDQSIKNLIYNVSHIILHILIYDEVGDTICNKSDYFYCIDDITFGKAKYPIKVKNNVNFENLMKFNYTIKNVFNIKNCKRKLENRFCVGCTCKGICRKGCECTINYTKDGKLKNWTSLIYECNSFCGCGIDCPNRVVQKGSNIKFEIFRTEEKGWGVRTLVCSFDENKFFNLKKIGKY